MKKDSKRGIKRSFCLGLENFLTAFGSSRVLNAYALIVLLGYFVSFAFVRIVYAYQLTFTSDKSIMVFQFILPLLLYFLVLRKMIALDRKNYHKERQRKAVFRDYLIFFSVLLVYWIVVGLITVVWKSF
jgi:hypothetical protein